jgi:hypothetical protein
MRCMDRAQLNDGSAAHGSTAAVGAFLPVIAVIFYLPVSVAYLIEPFREVDIRAHAAPPAKS